jgi:hypothetical protein
MTDLIQRLRTPLTYGGPTEYFRYMREAADELERLVQDSEARESWIRVQDDEIERLTRERDEALNELHTCLLGGHVNELIAERDRLRAALEQIAASSAIKFGDTHASYRWTKLRDTARAALADKEDPLVAKYEEWQEGK